MFEYTLMQVFPFFKFLYVRQTLEVSYYSLGMIGTRKQEH